ncbi:MAG: SPOR domain-containing protein, partial [Ignavibacteria bacterium]|nr:SPOR domain-containing protein [Ignavibacteria bacterium]
AAYFWGCSSGEYDIEEYKVDYTEKTVKTDTIKKLIVKDDQIKDDKNNKDNIKDNLKDSYSYVVQIGAFAVQSNFSRFLERARLTLGEGVYYEQSGNLYKIRIGKFNNRAEAIKFAELVKSKGYSDAFVITKKN